MISPPLFGYHNDNEFSRYHQQQQQQQRRRPQPQQQQQRQSSRNQERLVQLQDGRVVTEEQYLRMKAHHEKQEHQQFQRQRRFELERRQQEKQQQQQRLQHQHEIEIRTSYRSIDEEETRRRRRRQFQQQQMELETEEEEKSNEYESEENVNELRTLRGGNGRLYYVKDPLYDGRNFAILTKSGVTTTGTTLVDGDMGTSPIAQTALTGFALTLYGDHSKSSIVTGNVYAADHAVPTPTMMTTAIHDMEAAYTDAAGRTGPNGSTTVGLGLAGDISGMTLTSGVYKWSTDVKFNTELTFSGSATDVWIMQIAGTFTAGRGAQVKLGGNAKAENIFWAIADPVAFDNDSHGEGIFLAKTMISFNAGSSLYGAAFAQTAVTMISTTIEGALNTMP
ncbi:hypothetical protein FRACYDRAFT_219400 [Fragilariopsis cylindrus CCMP1102]|uniref:Uncharacterized protein n=1 Tax=Fragilariopsis cylindrus CCMP1102 TaxID=635003 RepID=A0A1E7F324_9STRA|nr:hypothetical protein FRACYDRAFT_219400 [Fragilariopsis cylindrus CCMP1102]|eukprot:OEU12536.1 hypothetical protein FRACYDRAFT_219400 [Fragilariopsis cylindrus CCMP1102]